MAAKVERGTVTKKSGTFVAACGCTHAYQDREYGKGRRLHNICAGGAKRRCTVCGKEAGV